MFLFFLYSHGFALNRKLKGNERVAEWFVDNACHSGDICSGFRGEPVGVAKMDGVSGFYS